MNGAYIPETNRQKEIRRIIQAIITLSGEIIRLTL
jgi:hypothetical protein